MRIVAPLVFALPLASFVALDPGGWYPFGPAKWFAVSVVSTAAVAAVLWRGGVRVPRVAGALWLTVLTLVLVSAVIGLDPRLAWLGTAERHLGLVAWLLFAACTIVGASLDRDEVRWFVRGTVVAAALCGTYALIELLGESPIRLDLETDRLGATFGSAAYLGAAMCFALPVCVGASLDRDEHRAWRIAAAAAAGVGAMSIVGSGTRGAWLGLCVAGLVVAVRSRSSWSVPSRRTMMVAGAGTVLIAVMVGPRLGDVLERDAGASSRFDEWSVAVDVIGDRPLLGGGPESYRLVVASSIDADYERSYGRATAPDRAHSAPLDVAAVAGIPAGLVYVALLVVVVLAAWRSIVGSGPLTGGLAVGVIAYVVQQLFLFPVAEIDPLFWVAAGALLTESGGAARQRGVLISARSRRAAATVAACVAVLLLVTGLLGVAADRLARRAAESTERSSALAAVERATALRPDMIRSHLLRADLEAGAGTLGGVDAAIASVERAGDWSPEDPIVRQERARLLTQRVEITGDSSDAQRAVDAWNDVVAHDPYCTPCLVGLGTAAVLDNDIGMARDAWQRAAELTDDPLPADLLNRLETVAGS